MKRMGGACGGDIKQFIGPIYHSGPQIRPPFATLPLVQNAGRGVGGGGGLYAGCDNFSCDYALSGAT